MNLVGEVRARNGGEKLKWSCGLQTSPTLIFGHRSAHPKTESKLHWADAKPNINLFNSQGGEFQIRRVDQQKDQWALPKPNSHFLTNQRGCISNYGV